MISSYYLSLFLYFINILSGLDTILLLHSSLPYLLTSLQVCTFISSSQKTTSQLTNVLAIVLLIFAHMSDKIKLRSPFILAGLFMLVLGFGINISDAPRGAKYFGTFFCVGGSYAAFPGVIAWFVSQHQIDYL